MKSSDLSLTIVIFIIFIGLYLFNIISVGIKTVEDNWPIYRCNPAVMPFASFFGQDPSENFNYCIQNMQANYLDYLLQPVNYNFSVIGNIVSSITEAINNIRGFFDYLRNMISDIVSSIFSVFLNILIEFQRLTINIKDLFSKLIGILVTLSYTLYSVKPTFESAWSGPPGQIIRFLDTTACFHPNTLIKLKDGEIVKMKDVKINSILKNGSGYICYENSTLIVMRSRENIYEIKNGENNETILVTGNHLIYDKILKQFILVKNLKDNVNKTQIKCDELFV